jgi:hypothetical protein
MKHFQPDTERLIAAFLSHQEVRLPEEIILRPEAHPESQLESAAKAISWKLAACEAIWSLIHLNQLLPKSADLGAGKRANLTYTTVYKGSGGGRGGLNEPAHRSICVPTQLMKPASADLSAYQPLTDGDLYLKELDIPNLPHAVESALREAVLCFRSELFTACLAMLLKAAEGVCLETGIAILKVYPEDWKHRAKHIDGIESPRVGFAVKIQRIRKLYEDRTFTASLIEESGVPPYELTNAMIWTDQVRESRNSIHYGVEPAMTNSYEKVAALLIGAVPHLKIVWKIKETSLKISSSGR